ncbi:alpha/beta fold hydrolase [Pigmentiphaga litoralis]|uniref:alpha/beta fold hydrolase n=1 Tax=Pigmentiphaga litoralis TaxID=516702 RepID=UPI003B43D349
MFDALAEALSNPIPLGRQQRYDAGYAGAAVLEPPSEPFIAVAHSFGMMRVLKDLPPHCLGIVCLNGFARFSAAPDFTAGTPLRLIDRMLQRLRQDPMGVVNTFRARCGAEPYPVTTELDVDALFEDLSALRDDDARTALAACPAPVVAVAAEDDPIVPAGMTAMTFAHLSSVSVVLLPEGGHLLPVTHPAECADAVRRMAGSPNPAPAVANVNDLALPGSMP